MLTLNDGRIELWQWDTGRKLTVDAECTQVHFSNKVFGRSIDVDVVNGVADIPDILLQTDKDLIAWAFVGTAENGYTKISKVFKVNRRNKPSDYVFTPQDQKTLGEIVERIENLEKIQDPDSIKNAVEDYLEQNPVEAPVQSVNGKTGKVNLTASDVGAISQDELQEATNKALAQAKESGEFDGDDYVLTPEDKAEIADMAAKLVEVPDSGGVGCGHVVQDTPPEDTSVLWVDPTDNSTDELPDSGGNVELDATLSEEGKAADAKAVGDALSKKLSSDDLSDAIDIALAQAKESGEFDGAPGYTPVKGTDYYTESDKTEIVNEVIAALPSWTGGSY